LPLTSATHLLTLEASFRADVATIAVRGDLDVATAPQLAEMLDLAVGKHPRKIVLDLREVDFLDCFTVNVIVGSAAEIPGRVTLFHPQPAVRRLLEILDLAQIVVIDPDPPPMRAPCPRRRPLNLLNPRRKRNSSRPCPGRRDRSRRPGATAGSPPRLCPGAVQPSDWPPQ
jgi:anti-sigma B factor antagonist